MNTFTFRSIRAVLAALLCTAAAFTTFAPAAQAQVDTTWAPVGAVWTYGDYDFISGYRSFNSTTRSVKDTVVQGKHCHKIVGDGVSLDPYHQLNSLPVPFVYTYKENGRVYVWNAPTQAFRLMFDFNTPAGNSYSVSWDTTAHIVHAIDSVMIDSHTGGKIIMTTNALYYGNTPPPFTGGHTGKCHENLGDLWSGYANVFGSHPVQFIIPACNEAYQLFCYTDPIHGTYHGDTQTWDNSSCVVATESTSENVAIQSIFPNPAANRVTLTLPSSSQTVRIYDAQGRLVATRTTNDTILEIDVTAWANGLYTATLAGSRAATRFVVLHE